MRLNIDDEVYNIKINKKISTKNVYIRVNDDLDVIVSANKFTSDRAIEKIINENLASIEKMIRKIKAKKIYNSKFFYLGKEYDVIYTNSDSIEFGIDKVFIGKNVDVDSQLKKLALPLFKERLDYIYSNFSDDIPYPSLTIRKMKSRWGVCNTKTKRVTLNLELIKKNISCLDYVIVHELSHLIHANHSKDFWNLVEKNYPEYKKVRKLMKEY